MSHLRALDVITPAPADFVAMGAAFVAYFVASFLWWGPLFGKKWAQHMGLRMDGRPPMALPMALQALGTLLLTYVLWHVMQAFVVTHEGGLVARGELDLVSALTGAFFVWLGFFVPVQLGRVAWEKASWGLFAINAFGHLVAIAVASVALALL